MRHPKKPLPFTEAFHLLRSAQEVDIFLRDLCTPAEIRAMEERWEIAQALDRGDSSYREIKEETGASLMTITRVARFLNEEPHQGYRLVLDRMRESKK